MAASVAMIETPGPADADPCRPFEIVITAAEANIAASQAVLELAQSALENCREEHPKEA